MIKEKKEKEKNIVDKLKEHKDITYLTILVLVFALFFTTFILLNNAETRCFEQFDNAMTVIEEDPCMNLCLNTKIIYSLNYNYTLPEVVYNEKEKEK